MTGEHQPHLQHIPVPAIPPHPLPGLWETPENASIIELLGKEVKALQLKNEQMELKLHSAETERDLLFQAIKADVQDLHALIKQCGEWKALYETLAHKESLLKVSQAACEQIMQQLSKLTNALTYIADQPCSTADLFGGECAKVTQKLDQYCYPCYARRALGKLAKVK